MELGDRLSGVSGSLYMLMQPYMPFRDFNDVQCECLSRVLHFARLEFSSIIIVACVGGSVRVRYQIGADRRAPLLSCYSVILSDILMFIPWNNIKIFFS